MYASLDSNNKVSYITSIPQTGENWVECDETVWLGDLYNGGQFTRPAAPNALTLQQQAHIALTRADVVAVRCFKTGTPYPAEWTAYSNALRLIDNGTDTTSTVLPTRPDYPAGT